MKNLINNLKDQSTKLNIVKDKIKKENKRIEIFYNLETLKSNYRSIESKAIEYFRNVEYGDIISTFNNLDEAYRDYDLYDEPIHGFKIDNVSNVHYIHIFSDRLIIYVEYTDNDEYSPSPYKIEKYEIEFL